MVRGATWPWCNPLIFLLIRFINQTHIVPCRKPCLIQALWCPDDVLHSGCIGKVNEMSESLYLCTQMRTLIICRSFLSLNNCLFFTFVQVPIARRPYSNPLAPFSLREINILCDYCGAEHWLTKRHRITKTWPASSTPSPHFKPVLSPAYQK
jgi:hypothetical protein